MKNKHILLLIAGIFISLSSIHAQAVDISYLCESKSSSGFLYNKSQKEWESTIFYANKKFIVKHHKKRWVVKNAGDIIYVDCDARFNDKGFYIVMDDTILK